MSLSCLKLVQIRYAHAGGLTWVHCEILASESGCMLWHKYTTIVGHHQTRARHAHRMCCRTCTTVAAWQKNPKDPLWATRTCEGLPRGEPWIKQGLKKRSTAKRCQLHFAAVVTASACQGSLILSGYSQASPLGLRPPGEDDESSAC